MIDLVKPSTLVAMRTWIPMLMVVSCGAMAEDKRCQEARPGKSAGGARPRQVANDPRNDQDFPGCYGINAEWHGALLDPSDGTILHTNKGQILPLVGSAPRQRGKRKGKRLAGLDAAQPQGGPRPNQRFAVGDLLREISGYKPMNSHAWPRSDKGWPKLRGARRLRCASLGSSAAASERSLGRSDVGCRLAQTLRGQVLYVLQVLEAKTLESIYRTSGHLGLRCVNFLATLRSVPVR